jgi:hypothetical protein
MGFSVVLNDPSGYLSNQVVNWAIGCSDPDNPKCTVHDIQHPRFHFSVESWMGAQRRVVGLPLDLGPTRVHSLDFALHDQYFLLPKVLEAELNDVGSGLDQYHCYNAHLFQHQVQSCFDSWQDMVKLLTPDALDKCSTDSDFSPPMSDHFLTITGILGSAQQINRTSSHHILCTQDQIWFSLACCHNTTLCVLIMVQYGRRQQAMQLDVFHNLSLAVVQVWHWPILTSS